MAKELEKTGWVIDPYQDANGHWTIRPADGTPTGNTAVQPIATVYDLDIAMMIASLPKLMQVSFDLSERLSALKTIVNEYMYHDW